MCGSRSLRGPLLADVREALLGQQVLSARQFALEAGDEADHALGLVAADDGAAVRKPGQRVECAVAAVDAVQMHVGRRVGAGQRARDRPQDL